MGSNMLQKWLFGFGYSQPFWQFGGFSKAISGYIFSSFLVEMSNLYKGGFKLCILTQLEVSSPHFDDIYDPPPLL